MGRGCQAHRRRGRSIAPACAESFDKLRPDKPFDKLRPDKPFDELRTVGPYNGE
jgi:hypothetical protein